MFNIGSISDVWSAGMHIKYIKTQGSIVQIIVNVTRSFRDQLLMYYSVYIELITEDSYFSLEKCKNLLQCNRFSHFS